MQGMWVRQDCKAGLLLRVSPREKAEAHERIADVGNMTQGHPCSLGSLTLAHWNVGFSMGPMRLP